MPEYGLLRQGRKFFQPGSCRGKLAPGKFDPGKQEFAENESVDGLVVQSGYPESAFCLFFRFVQVVPFIVYPGQAVTGLVGIRLWVLAK